MAPSPQSHLALIASSVFLVLVLASGAAAVEVRGSVNIPKKLIGKTVSDPQSFYWEEWNGFLPPRSDERMFDARRAMSIVLTGKGGSPRSSFKIRGGDLYPNTLVVKTGSKVRIENTDGCSHELYSPDLEGFEALQTASGNARVIEATKAGHYIVKDKIYPHLEGHIHVIDDLVAHATVTETGRFTFDVDEGEYTLKVYMKDAVVGSATVRVASGRRPITLDPIRLRAGAKR